ncbi:MAG TPA: type II secretion system secretin GspD [Methylomirabilota bacterium]|jgi:general secretion pathway protein D
MRSAKHASKAIAAAVVLTLVAGCATPHPAAQAPAPAPPVAAPTPTPPPAPPAAEAPTPSLPPVSIGPRPEVAPEPTPAPRAQTPTPAMPPPTVPPVAAGQRGRFVVLNFDNADIETVIHAASEIVGFNYVLSPDVRGKVTVQTAGRIPQEDVFGVLLAILELHGFTAVKSGNLYKIVRIEGARERAVPTIVGNQADPARTTDEIVTQIVPVKFASVNDLSTLLRPLISARGTLIAHRETNVLMITDAASNIRRLLDIVRLVDVEVALEELSIIPVRFADAADLATILNQLFTTGRVRTGAAGPPGAPGVPPVPRVPPTGGGTVPTAPGAPSADSGTDRQPLIIPERRSNSLIVHARRNELETIKRLIAQLDVNIYGGRRVFIYYAENAKAKDLAATLNSIYAGRDTVTTASTTPTTRRPGEPPTPPPPPPTVAPGAPTGGAADASLLEGQVRFIADETTNAVIVTTYPRNWTEIEGTIKQLDRMPRQVLIEVLVTEITLTDDTRLGVDWALKEGSFRLAQQSINPDTPQIQAPSTRIPPATTLLLPAGGLTAMAFAADKFFAMLNVLAAENRVNVLSSPHVLTSENKKAVINVSDSIPIVTSQQVPIGGTTTPTSTATTAVIGTQSVEYRDAGVILTVTPRIGERGTVALDVKQEVNDIGASEPPTGSRRIIKREAETSVVLLNNQTLVLGGLIKDRKSNEDRGIPWLKNIPLLGYLFGAKAVTITKTELLILITPRVIGTAVDAARITEEMKRATPSLEESIRRAPRQPTILPPPPPPPEPSSVPPSSPPSSAPPGSSQ